MAVFNLKKRELMCKIVYYGPARGGKTSNLKYISKAFQHQVIGEMVSINTAHDSTLFFDFIPVGLGEIGAFKARAQLYTVPGQVRYDTTRKLVLRGVDGVVFVADSLTIRRDNNRVSLKNLEQNLRDIRIDISEIPLVMQYNKRDLEEAGIPLMPIHDMEKDLNGRLKAPSFSSSAIYGHGVGDTLKKCLEMTFHALKKNRTWPRQQAI
jgi:signal recognition particle receptor subunit beta